jgi:hypothetical protein
MSFREELYILMRMNTERTEKPNQLVLKVQEEATACCEIWGHDFDKAEEVMSAMAQLVPQTVGGTPVISNRRCSRCGHVPKPGELRRLHE